MTAIAAIMQNIAGLNLIIVPLQFDAKLTEKNDNGNRKKVRGWNPPDGIFS
jgi:hypothetical protein